ncbi:ARMT1-like domain-containing protein [Actinoplanes sp. NPDC049802]|uniref:damage-control phosphatase ARMT1 family protein n=1 Tax=Actinoplanes sp. NPDC049802 TaxID=3154742 RepID=UPI00340EB8C1
MDERSDCVACFLRQGTDVSHLLPEGPARRSLMATVERLAYEADPARPSVAVGQTLHRSLRALTGDPDPYLGAKIVFNKLILGLVPELRRMIQQAPDPLLLTVRLAIAANVIDLGSDSTLTPAAALSALRGVLQASFHEDWTAFTTALSRARSILYLTDNAGEIVVDRLLVEAIGPDRVTVAVRGGPIINDATIEDARATGLDSLVEVIDNGSDAPGTLLDECGLAFRERFEAADMIIAKGQGNFETLSDVDRPLFFLFKVKCPVIAAHAGLPMGTHALIGRSRPSADRPRPDEGEHPCG